MMWRDIDFEQGIISISRCVVLERSRKILKDELKNKTYKRTVPLLPTIKSILETKPRVGQFVFPTGDGSVCVIRGFCFIKRNSQ